MNAVTFPQVATEPIPTENIPASFTQTINGHSIASEKSFGVVNPATGEVFAYSPDASKEELDLAVSAARQAQTKWARHSPQERRDFILAYAQAIREERASLAKLLTLEQGKPWAKALDEIDRATRAMDLLSSISIEPELLHEDATGRTELHYRPLGVMGAITPWNVPIVLAAPKITQALYTGNTVVLKPSPYTPLTTLEIGRISRAILPPGVLNILAGGNDLGQWICEHPGIAKISFTGSVATGKKVSATAAATLKRVTLELGGNDAAIVLDDVNPEEIADRLFWAAFHNSGQICMAIKRLYVHESIYEAMCQALAERAQTVKVGNGLDPDTMLGPVQNKMQFEIVRSILEDTRQQPGVRILAGGEVADHGGYFIQPTIVAGASEGMRIVDEEPFGPILPVLSYRDIDEAVERANCTHFGLGGSVWSSDPHRAKQIASRLEAGTVWVNHHLGTDMFAPFGGAKQSGVGREYSVLGLKSYMEPQVIKAPV